MEHHRSHGRLEMWGRCTLLIVLLTASGVVATAQIWQVGGSLAAGFPQGAFKDRIGSSGIGASVHFGYSPHEQPYLFGLHTIFLNYGSQSWWATAGGRDLEIQSANNILLVHAFGRIQSDAGMFRPYLEGSLGVTWLFTTSSFDSWSDSGGDPETTVRIEFGDTAFSYGGGGGLTVCFLSSVDEGGDMTEWCIDLGARYLAGARSQYLKGGSIQTSGGTVAYTPLESDTDLLVVTAGVIYRF
jgi:hypothetical protein